LFLFFLSTPHTTLCTPAPTIAPFRIPAAKFSEKRIGIENIPEGKPDREVVFFRLFSFKSCCLEFPMSEFAERTSSAARSSQRVDELDHQIAAVRAKLTPLQERTESLNRQAVEVRKQLGEMAERLTAFGAEVVAVQREILDTDKIIDSVVGGLDGIRTEIANAAALEAAHQTLSSMFGEAFQVVSRFFDTAQRLGLVGKDVVGTRSIPSISTAVSTVASLQEPVTVDEAPVVEEAPVITEEPVVAMEPIARSLPDAIKLSDWSAPLETDDMPPPVELPPLPDVSAAEDDDDSDLKDVEELLAGLSTPIST